MEYHEKEKTTRMDRRDKLVWRKQYKQNYFYMTHYSIFIGISSYKDNAALSIQAGQVVARPNFGNYFIPYIPTSTAWMQEAGQRRSSC